MEHPSGLIWSDLRELVGDLDDLDDGCDDGGAASSAGCGPAGERVGAYSSGACRWGEEEEEEQAASGHA